MTLRFRNITIVCVLKQDNLLCFVSSAILFGFYANNIIYLSLLHHKTWNSADSMHNQIAQPYENETVSKDSNIKLTFAE